MEYEYQWEKDRVRLKNIKPGQLFVREIFKGLIYKCHTVDKAGGRMFLEIHSFDESFPVKHDNIFYIPKKCMGERLIWNIEIESDWFIVEKTSYSAV
jgi:hypothetical protein